MENLDREASAAASRRSFLIGAGVFLAIIFGGGITVAFLTRQASTEHPPTQTSLPASVNKPANVSGGNTTNRPAKTNLPVNRGLAGKSNTKGSVNAPVNKEVKKQQ